MPTHRADRRRIASYTGAVSGRPVRGYWAMCGKWVVDPESRHLAPTCQKCEEAIERRKSGSMF